MKKRVFNVLNFLALNILFFALYLNFIHKDVNQLPAVATQVAAKSLDESKNPVAVNNQQKKKTIPAGN